VTDDVGHGGHLAAGPVQRVAALDADRLDVDEHAARIHDGISDILVAKDVGRSGLVVHGSFHAAHATYAVRRTSSSTNASITWPIDGTSRSPSGNGSSRWIR